MLGEGYIVDYPSDANTLCGDVYLGETTPRTGVMHGLWLKKDFIKSLLLAKE
jgi:hypothetical protein